MKDRTRNEAAPEAPAAAPAAAPKQVPLTIARLGAAAGVGVETVRYYQRRGLLAVPAGGGGVRRYDEEDVRRLRFIRRAQAAGFTLEEISELLALDRTDDRARVRRLASECRAVAGGGTGAGSRRRRGT